MPHSKKPLADSSPGSSALYDDFVSHLQKQKKPLPPNAAKAVAQRQLEKGGYMSASGGLTPKGKARQAMGPAARAKLRQETR